MAATPVTNLRITAEDLLRREYAPLEYYMGKWLFGGSLALVYGDAGTGKSFFALAVAYAAAAGNTRFIHWYSQAPKKVLYFDSEMGTRLLQERLSKICDCFPNDVDGHRIAFVSHEDCPGGMIWNLANYAEQDKYTQCADGYDLIIIDNLSGCIRPTGRETIFETWPRAQQWLIKMREMNKCVLILHHSGKDGTMRGPSMQKDVVDFCLELRRPKNYNTTDGLRMELRFKKQRHYIGEEGAAIEVRFQNTEGEKPMWLWDQISEEVKESKSKAAKDLFGDF
jgi:RecA-family ATPase